MRTGLGIVILAGLLSACAPIVRNHGYVPPASDLRRIEVGRATRDDVASLVGRPTATGVLGETGWYYVQSQFRTLGPRPPREVDREVVAISFSPGGTVTNVERFGLENGRVVPLSRAVTGGGAADVGFIQQLFGNLGNINAGDLLGE